MSLRRSSIWAQLKHSNNFQRAFKDYECIAAQDTTTQEREEKREGKGLRDGILRGLSSYIDWTQLFHVKSLEPQANMRPSWLQVIICSFSPYLLAELLIVFWVVSNQTVNTDVQAFQLQQTKQPIRNWH